MKKLLLITLICLIAVAMFAGTPRAYTQKVATSSDGELPFVTNTSTATAPDYICTSYITSRPGEILSTSGAIATIPGGGVPTPVTTIRLYRFGNGTTIPYLSAFFLQLGTFSTQWLAGDVVHTTITYIPTGISVSWDMTIPAGTAAITYRLPTDPIPSVIYDPIPAAPVPDPAVYVAPPNGAIGLGYAGQVLSWNPAVTGGVPTGYQVYFGMDNPPMMMVADLVGTTWPTPPLAQNTTYYWQIVPYNAEGPAVGNAVWNFTTRGEMNPNPAENPFPADGATFPSPVVGGFVQTISWSAPSTGVTPTGYKLAYMGVPPIDIGNVLTTTVLINGPGVITWQIIPYYIDGGMRKVDLKPIESTLGSNTSANVRGDAVGCPVWTFTVTDYVPMQYPVNVTSTPAGAAIYVNGIDSGFVTPYIFMMAEGTSALYSVQMAGYDVWMPADYQVTNIMAPDAVNFVGILNTYPVLIESTPVGAAIFVNGLPSGFMTPYTFMMGYGTSAIYTVQLPQYTWMPTEYAVNNIMAPDGVMFMGTFVPFVYNFTVTSVPTNADIYVGGVDSGFNTPYVFQMVQGSGAVYSVMKAGYSWAPVDYTVTNIMAEGNVEFVGSLLPGDGMIESGIPELIAPPPAFATPGPFIFEYMELPPASIPYVVNDFTTQNALAPSANPMNDNTNTFGLVLTTRNDRLAVNMAITVPAGMWYVGYYQNSIWYPASPFPYMNTVPGVVNITVDTDLGPTYWYIGTYNPNVPVELMSFSAVATASDFVSLTWVTASETGAQGFNLYRGDTNNVNDASKINLNIIEATNTSQTHTYNYVDDEGLVVGNTYYYWLESVDLTGYSVMSNGINVTITGGGTPELPELSVLSNAYPNPFRAGGSTNINVEIKEGETGTVTVYNLLGQAVKTYRVSEGQHSLTWNANGCASGIYFYKLSTPTTNSTKKLVIVN